jgi:hypothetical protein
MHVLGRWEMEVLTPCPRKGETKDLVPWDLWGWKLRF